MRSKPSTVLRKRTFRTRAVRSAIAVFASVALAAAPVGGALAYAADSDTAADLSLTVQAPPAAPGGAGGFFASSSTPTWSGATTITSSTSTTGKTYSSTTAGQNAVLVDTSGTVVLTNPTVTKSGGTSAGDSESFYGTNSAVMCKGGGTTTITGAEVVTNAAGANGVFSYGGNASTNATSGDGTTVVISNSTITTTGNGSGGIMTTGQGVMKASNLTVSTAGASSAAIRSDRGGGTVTVNGGTYETSGVGSPAIYATATITVSDATLTSTASQGVVNEGGNSVTLEDCTLNAANKTLNSQDKFRNGVFLYQSMSGDASEGASKFSMTGGTLNNTYGHVIHVTNTSAAITLSGVAINNTDSEGVFLSVCDDAWSGLSNAATVTAKNQVIDGDVLVGSDSTATIKLSGASIWTGATSGKITDHKSSATVSSSIGTVNVVLGSGSTWTLTGNSHVTSISGAGSVCYGSYKLYVNGTAYTASNPYSGVGSTTSTPTVSVAAASVSGVPTTKAYTGSAIKPVPTVKIGSTTLVRGTDYTLSYANNKKAGKATITIKGKGNYKGTKKATFIIKPAKVTGLKVTSTVAGKATAKWATAKAVAAGATGYQVYYKVAGKSARKVLVSNVSTAKKVVTGLTQGKKATFKVRAYKTVGSTKYYGAWSAAASVTVKK